MWVYGSRRIVYNAEESMTAGGWSRKLSHFGKFQNVPLWLGLAYSIRWHEELMDSPNAPLFPSFH